MGARRGVVFLALVAAVFLVGCSDQSSGPLAALSGGGGTAGDVLYVSTPDGVTALDVNTAAARFDATGGVAAPDWSLVYTTETIGGGTLVEALDPETGAIVFTRRVQIPNLVARLASSSGNAVVLGPPAPDATHPYPKGRRRTELVVVNIAGDARVYDLKGNLEPEAFSTDLSSLFVVDYTPAAAPVQYRVRRLDLTTARVHDVFSRDQELQESMPGTARTQTRSADGTRVYTLYEVEDLGTAFIHVLDLEEEWAHCIDLPRSFGKHPGGASTLTVSPDGASLYAIDRSAGALADVDTDALEVRRKASLTPQPGAKGAASAFFGGLLFVGGGTQMTAVDTNDLAISRVWKAVGDVSAVQPSSDGEYLYVGLQRRVAVLHSSNGEREQFIDVPGDEPITSLGSPGLSPDRGSIQCAC